MLKFLREIFWKRAVVFLSASALTTNKHFNKLAFYKKAFGLYQIYVFCAYIQIQEILDLFKQLR